MSQEHVRVDGREIIHNAVACLKRCDTGVDLAATVALLSLCLADTTDNSLPEIIMEIESYAMQIKDNEHIKQFLEATKDD